MDEEEDGGGDDYIEFEDEDIDRIWKDSSLNANLGRLGFVAAACCTLCAH
jgi:hypothetical protein